jgi:hypothetical protein
VAIVNRTTIQLSVIFLALAAMVGAGLPAYSQTPPGVPDVSGIWAWGRCVAEGGGGGGRGFGGGGIGCMIIEPDDERLTDRARAFVAAFDEIAQPKYDCAPMSIPHMYTDPYEYQLEQFEDRVIITYEKDDVVRTVWLEGHGHERPPINQFFYHGYATGRYEGDTLIVETTRFTFDPQGINSDFKMPSSSQKRVTERFTPQGDALLLEVTTEDTFFLAEPWTYRVVSQPVEGELNLPWNCDLEAARQTLKLVPTDYPDDPEIVRIEQ